MIDFQEAKSNLHEVITSLEYKPSGNSAEDYQWLTTYGINATEAIQSIGNYSWELIQKDDWSDQQQEFNAKSIHFDWMEKAKSYLIMIRDVLFQHHKGLALIADGKMTVEELEEYSGLSTAKLKDKAQLLIKYLDGNLGTDVTSKDGKSYFKKWNIQHNPWETYQKQIQGFRNQFKILSIKSNEVSAIIACLGKITNIVTSNIELCDKKIIRKKKAIEGIIGYIKDEVSEISASSLEKVISKLEEIEDSIQPTQHSALFSQALEDYLAELPVKTKIPVRTNQGELVNIDFNIRRRTKQWIESEITPLLYEVWEITENVANGTRMTLVNIRNRVRLAKDSEAIDLDKTTLTPPLEIFLSKIRKAHLDLTDLNDLIDKRVNEEFSFSVIYENEEEVLPVKLQKSINQIKLGQNRVQAFLKKNYDRVAGVVSNYKRQVEIEESLSLSEKIVRYIEGRRGDAHNSYYTNIFLTKGYVGESFWVGRNDKKERMQTLIENWGMGFRGAVMITGNRHSGKSLFSELIANQHFRNNTYRVLPNTNLEVNGRKIRLEYDLRPAFNLIREYGSGSRSLVVIDDLELWHSTEVPLNKNVRLLKRFIDNHTHQFFFIICMSSPLKKHLRQYHEIDKVFQAEINLNKMKLEDVEEAIMVRHGATHKILVNENGENLAPRQFKRIVRKIFSASEGNIGEALNLWAYSTRRVTDLEVINQYKAPYSLPNFLNPDVGILLATIMLMKRTNERQLRRLFGPSFNAKYLNILKRLLGVGIVLRTMDDWLEINDLTVARVEDLLTKNGYL